MDRRAFVVGTLSLLAATLAAEAQPAAKLPRVGYLSPWSAATDPFRVDAFRDALREQGYVDGTNVVVVPRFADEDYQRLPVLAADLVKMNVEVIVALTTPVARVAQRATPTIPIVFTYVSDAVRTGLVASLARPGGNLTGYSDITADLVQKRLGLLKEVLPRVTRVGVLKNPGNPGIEIVWSELESAARQLGLELYGRDVQKGDDLEGAFSVFAKARVGCVILVADSVFAGHRQAIARLATNRRLPLMGWTRAWSEAGAVLSYGANTTDVQRRVASYVARILKGAKPADLPVEEATRFTLVINLKTAKALGLTIPPSVLARADEVIE
jgi:putative ABC transport system substrate-binding protein